MQPLRASVEYHTRNAELHITGDPAEIEYLEMIMGTDGLDVERVESHDGDGKQTLILRCMELG